MNTNSTHEQVIKNCVIDEFNTGVWNNIVIPEEKEEVNHPDHYNWFGIECIEVVEHFPFNLGNAIKYIWRAGRKDDIIVDLKKAIWCIQREIDRLQKE